MKTRPKLIRVLTPPPLAPSNLLNGPDLTTVVNKALVVSLAQAVPTAVPVSQHPPTTTFKLHLITLHPVQPLVVYLLIPEGPDRKAVPQSIVVQNVRSRQVVWSTTLSDVASSVYDYDVLAAGVEAKQHKILKELGDVQRLDFLDPSTLYWSGYGTTSSTTPTDGGGDEANKHEQPQRWNHLMVQFKNRILILNMRQPSGSLASNSVSGGNFESNTSPSSWSFVEANISPAVLLGGTSVGNVSSNAVVVSPESLIVACDDGSVKLYNWRLRKIVQSIPANAWSGIKTDFVVEIISTNPFPASPDELYKTKGRPRTVVCLTKKGAAFLCPLGTSSSDHMVTNILPPVARMEGGSVPTSMSVQDDETSMEHRIVQYCPFRDMLLWKAPSKQKSKLFAWDLSSLLGMGEKSVVAKPDPILTLQFPYENVSHTVFAGWFHEAVPKESMTCVAVTKDGELQISVAPILNNGSSPKHPFSAATIQGVNLIQIMQRDLDLPEERAPDFKVQSISGLHLRDSSVFFIGTSIGILLIRMIDGNLVSFPGTRNAHLSANVGTMGKSILTVRGPQILYSPLEPEGGLLENNPIGKMDSTKKVTVVYESPAPLHLPPEIHKRPVRLPPRFLLSPSRSFVCCFWKEEMRYEVLDLTNMLDRVTSRNPIALGAGNSPVVASGNGVSSFAWVGYEDVFALLYDPEQDLALKAGVDLSAPGASMTADAKGKLKELGRLKTYKKGVKSMAGTAGKLKSLEGLRDLGKDTGKALIGVKKLTMGTVKATGKVATGVTSHAATAATSATSKTTKKMTKMAVGGTKKGVSGVAKIASFGMWKKKGQDKKGVEGSLAGADMDDDDEAPSMVTSPLDTASEMDDPEAEERAASEQLEKKFPWVELRVLVSSTNADGTSSSATASNLGQLNLRSGNRNPPTALFGGPVLLVGSKIDENDEGLAYFYTKKKGQEEEIYVSSGPAFPCPDLVAWDKDGRLCAVVIQDRVSVYFSEEPDFVMLGSVRIGCASDVDVESVSARFIHGVLFCSTRSSIQCIFLGNLDGGVCHLDSFILASAEVPLLPSKDIVTAYNSLSPPTIPMPLSHPEVLGYQNGSLVVSTVSGIVAVPLGFPLLRVGTLVSAGPEHYSKAEKWFQSIPSCDHEVLASFLERRGVPELALELPGISLETVVDMCMRYEYVDRLEEVVEEYGLGGLRAIDMGRGISVGVFGAEESGASLVVCVGAYLLSHGRVELVRRLATECLASAETWKRDAFMLASLLLSVNMNDSKRVIQRAVEDADEDEWIVGAFVRDNVLPHAQ